LAVQLESGINVLALEALSSFGLQFFTFRKIFPVFLVLYTVRVNLECLLDVLLTHFLLSIVEQNATTPVQEFRGLNKLVLHFGSE
jgi:hypothetical protein